MKIIKATVSDLNNVALLFDSYRQFYAQQPDRLGAKAFIEKRLVNNDSVIFMALSDTNTAIGFAQLYPSFSSVAMKRMWYLNDLFVTENARQQGVASALLKEVEMFAKQSDALTVKVATAVTNKGAKALYESNGYIKITTFEHYTQQVKFGKD